MPAKITDSMIVLAFSVQLPPEFSKPCSLSISCLPLCALSSETYIDKLPRQTIKAFSARSVGHRLAIAESNARARAAAGGDLDRAKVRKDYLL